MSGSLTLALRSAQSGLLTHQSALDAVANNVANVNTENYSRKIVNLEQRVVSGVGAGVQLSDVSRAVDEGLLKSMRLEQSTFNNYDAQKSYFARMQDMFGAPGDNTSIAQIMTDLSSATESLAQSPDQSLQQSEFVRQGEEAASKLKQMSDTVQELRRQADQEIGDAVNQINSISSQLVDLNNKIIRNSAIKSDVTDLRDQRDAKLDQLSKLVDISYFYRGGGDVVVFTKGGRTLVDNSSATVEHISASNVAPTTTHAEGDFNPIYVGTKVAANDITNEIRDGRLKGLITLRDSTLPNLQSQIDAMAAQLRDSVNQIHNRGTPFPGMTEMNGTRAFIDPATQTIQLGNNSDVRITLFDNSGNQHNTTTLQAIMNSASYGGAAQPLNGAWTVNSVATTVQDWLRANGASGATAAVDANTGKLNINLNSTTYALGFRDEVNSAGTVPAPPGSTAADATIKFDANADGSADQTVSGFSNFFGLNDYYVDKLSDNVWESNVMDTGYTSPKAATLKFYDTTTVPVSGAPLGTVSIAAGDSVSTIASNINLANIGVTATAVPDGSGFRLRIAHNNGLNLAITQNVAGGDTFLNDVSLHSADVRVGQQLEVRADIVQTPGKVTRGTTQWDASLGAAGEYFQSSADASSITSMAQMFTSPTAFNAAGGLTATNGTFANQAAQIVSFNANLAAVNDSKHTYQKDLSDSLKNKSDTFRGVNLDEEMSNLMVFQQGYSASARVVSVIQKMFDVLDQIVK